MNWQPIETAPIGISILIYDSEREVCSVATGFIDDGDPLVYFIGDEDNFPYDATHWMPLPEPPLGTNHDTPKAVEPLT